jgi:hypothetical protein
MLRQRTIVMRAGVMTAVTGTIGVMTAVTGMVGVTTAMTGVSTETRVGATNTTTMTTARKVVTMDGTTGVGSNPQNPVFLAPSAI